MSKQRVFKFGLRMLYGGLGKKLSSKVRDARVYIGITVSQSIVLAIRHLVFGS